MKMDQERINLAIRNCLRRCYAGTDILPTIAAFVADIKATGNWSHEEIRAIEIGVHLMLRHILAPIYPGDATNQPASEWTRQGVKSAKMTGI